MTKLTIITSLGKIHEIDISNHLIYIDFDDGYPFEKY